MPPSRFRGLLLGTAVGDALGLPVEAMSRRRMQRFVRGNWRHRFFFGHGMVSDDTDHTVFIAQSLLAHPDAPEQFARRFGWCLRAWLLSLPAGIGGATLRSTLRLWVGFPATRSGVRSAGNGAAMRAAPIGAFFSGDDERLERFVRAATRVTHDDPRALEGARAIARTAARAVNLLARPGVDEFAAWLRTSDAEWNAIVDRLADSLRRGESTSAFAGADGVSGFVYATVPVALHAWYTHYGNFEATLIAALDCGGDTDTVGAIAGALAGATSGDEAIPAAWIDGIIDWPRGMTTLREIGNRLAARDTRPVRYFWPGILLRNALVFIVVLAHLIRRALPPY
jgi:ADP-ribosyl-[dinitrogen reductase] hydrolase